MTKNTSRKKYTSVFKTQAVEMAALRGDISAVAQELQINETNLRRWIADPRYSTSVPNESGESTTTLAAQTAQEMKQMRRELALLRAENQVLKKAAIILGSSQGT
jgi:transposase-like protein